MNLLRLNATVGAASLLLIAFGTCQGQTYTISTFAGTGTAGNLGDGGPAASAQLTKPAGVTLDSAGNVYIADYGNYRIRKVQPNGTISLVAGTRFGAAAGNGVPAVDAVLNSPTGVAVDALPDIYISDNANIRKVDTSGIISSFSNFVGSLCSSNCPSPIAIDPSGTIYLADPAANTVKRVSPGGIAATIAGTARGYGGDGGPATQARFYQPEGVAVDGAGNLYIADFNNHCVRKVDTAGIIATFAGHCTTSGSSGDGGLATAALLNLPSGVAVDSSGNVFIVDSSLRVRRVSNGIITTIAGNGTFGKGGDGGPALSAQFELPLSIAVASDGRIFVSDWDANVVRVLTPGPSLAITTSSLPKATAGSSYGPVQLAASGANGTVTWSQTGLPASTGLTLSAAGVLSGIPVTGSQGTYVLTVSASNAGAAVNAKLSLTIDGISPVSTCAPTFNYTAGQAAPVPVTCQFTATASGPYTVSTTSSWLLVTPASGTLGSNPTALSVAVAPSGLAGGQYASSFTISGTQFGSYTVQVQLTVAAGTPGNLVATPTFFSFTYQQGTPAPQPQQLTISATNGSLEAFSVKSSQSWLLPGVNGGTTPEEFNVSVSPVNLDPNTYTATLTISANGTAPVTVNVMLSVIAASVPKLTVDTSTLNLSGFPGGSPATAQLNVANGGGGTLNFTASASAPWLTVSSASGSVSSTALSLIVTADPATLKAGTYRATVTITGAGTTVAIPVTFSVAAPTPVILISQTGIGFVAVVQGGAPLPQQFGILNIGTGTLNWSAKASTLSGGNWLRISPTSGLVQRPYLDVSLVSVSIDPTVVTALTAGDYYGQIQVASNGAVNTPQLVTVILSMLPQGSNPGPEVRPSSLIFTGVAGATPSPQNVVVGVRSAQSDGYNSGSIGRGFSYTPNLASVAPNQPTTLQVSPDFSALQPGSFERGTITLQFQDGTPRNISILTVVAPAGTTSGATNGGLGAQAASNCSSPTLTVQVRSPQPFSAVLGQGAAIEVQVVDACGNLITEGTVNATFSNRDQQMKLNHIGNGIWSGSWRPVNPSATAVAIGLTAFASGTTLYSGQTSLMAALNNGTSKTPVVTAKGVVHAASNIGDSPIAPGSLLTIYGANLANGIEQPSSLPLPTMQSGATVFLGARPMPILYASEGQINVQVPFDTPINTQYQILVQRDNVVSIPEPLAIAEAQPGIFTTNQQGTGQGVILKSDQVTRAEPGTPASAGEVIVIYCTGLGAVTPPVAEGQAAPNPAAVTTNEVTATIGGQSVTVVFSGLSPGTTGLYQVNAIVPSGVSGDAVPVVIQVAGQTSPVVTMAVQ